MIGKELLGYTFTEKIGSGSFGTVYKAEKQNSSGYEVRAVKHIRIPHSEERYRELCNSVGNDPVKLHEYIRHEAADVGQEIRNIRSICEEDSRYVVRYYENHEEVDADGVYRDLYLFMEYLTPFSAYRQQNDMTVADVIRLGKDILHALIVCHGYGMIHRDIKEDNIFVARKSSGDVIYKLGDFGIAKNLGTRQFAESYKGTPYYLAPEIHKSSLSGRVNYTNSVDIYSLGIVLYRQLNMARNPFLPPYPAPIDAGMAADANIRRLAEKDPIPLPYCADNHLGKVIEKALLPVGERYRSAQEFLDALSAVEEELGRHELSRCVNSDRTGHTTVRGYSGADASGDATVPLARGGEKTVGGIAFFGSADSPADASVSPSYPHFGTVSVDHRNRGLSGEGQGDRVNLMGSVDNNRGIQAPSSDDGGLSGASGEERGFVFGSDESKEVRHDSNSPKWEHQKSDPYGVTNNTTPMSAPKNVSLFSRKDLKGLVYALPFIIVALYIITNLIVIPIFYDTTISIVDWLFGKTSDLIEMLANGVSPGDFDYSDGSIKDILSSDKVLPLFYTIIFLKVWNWILFLAFSASLFWFGYTIHHRKPKYHENARVIDHEADYEMNSILLDISAMENIPRTCLDAVRRAQAKLRNAKRFGVGNDQVTALESRIAELQKKIRLAMEDLNDPDRVKTAADVIESSCNQIERTLTQINQLTKK